MDSKEIAVENEAPAAQKNKITVRAVFIRAVNILAATLLLIILSWFILICILVKWLEDFHNPVYLSERADKNGKAFKFVKIRTMCPRADELKRQLIDAGLNEADPPFFKMTNDPRITKVGNFYRKYRLDNLPGLLNVIAGQVTVSDIFRKNSYNNVL